MNNLKLLKSIKSYLFALSFIFCFIGCFLYLNNKSPHLPFILQLTCLLIYYPLELYYHINYRKKHYENKEK